MSLFNIDRRALAELTHSEEVGQHMYRVGTQVRDRARANAKAVVPAASPTSKDPFGAIISQMGTDDEGHYVDVGYMKHHPGFYLWWWEVGTVNHPARPHLRPALDPGALERDKELVEHTTQDGRTRMATRAQVANWTRGRRA